MLLSVRDLMVRHGKNPAGTRVENFQAELILHRQPALLAEQAVEMNRRIHVRDAVFGKQDHLDIARTEVIQQVADDGINRALVGNEGGIDLVAAAVRRL